MKLSPLQLTEYILTDIACTANPNFDPQKEIQGALEQLSINAKATPAEPKKEDPSHPWSVELTVTQTQKEGNNFPYEFRITLLGMFAWKDGASDNEKETRFVQVNGSSMLYGMVREHIRALTAAGPWGVIILPTVSFYDNNEQTQKKEAQVKTEAK